MISTALFSYSLFNHVLAHIRCILASRSLTHSIFPSFSIKLTNSILKAFIQCKNIQIRECLTFLLLPRILQSLLTNLKSIKFISPPFFITLFFLPLLVALQMVLGSLSSITNYTTIIRILLEILHIILAIFLQNHHLSAIS